MWHVGSEQNRFVNVFNFSYNSHYTQADKDSVTGWRGYVQNTDRQGSGQGCGTGTVLLVGLLPARDFVRFNSHS